MNIRSTFRDCIERNYLNSSHSTTSQANVTRYARKYLSDAYMEQLEYLTWYF